MLYFILFISAVVLCSVFVYLARLVSFEKKIVNDAGIPLLGGAAVYLAVFHLIGIYNYFSRIHIAGIFLPATVILALGLIDDLRPIGPYVKIFTQAVAAVLLIMHNISTQIAFLHPAANIILTIFWVILITNAFNLFDIMDGLAGGLALIISLTFFVISLMTDNQAMAVLSVCLAGALAAFLKWNFPPAKIYLGNSGSILIGFLLSATSLSVSYALPGKEIALFTPLIILGLPLYDTGFVVLIRILKGRSPIRKSRDHFALRLLETGFSEKKALAFMYLFCVIFCICALLVNKVTNLLGIMLIASLGLISLFLGSRIAKVNVGELR